jgi:hypothetical protein
MASGIALAFIARHSAVHNMQIVIVPIAIGFAAFLLHLIFHTCNKSCQLLLCAALLGYPAFHITGFLMGTRMETGKIAQNELQSIIDLAKPGKQTCIAFAPDHPIFCRDVSGLSNGWDVTFPERIQNPQQLQRFRELWQHGIRQTIDQKPEIIVRASPQRCWERAVHAGLISAEQLLSLDALRPAYDVRMIGEREVWIRHPH